jgi:hypothetical protein
MVHQRALHFHRAEAVPRHIDDIVDAPQQPEVAVLVLACAVAREVDPVVLAPVGLDEALGVAPQPARHRRPRARNHQVAALIRAHRLALVVQDGGEDARKRLGRRAGLRGDDAWQRGNHNRARLGLPPSVHNRAASAADMLVVPHPRFGVNRLADRPQQAQAAQVVLVRVLLAPLHKRADGGRRSIEDRRAVLLHNRPESVAVGVVGRAFVHDAGRPVRQRSVHQITVPRHPADIGGTPEHILVLEVEHPLGGQRHARHVAACGVHNAFGFARRARGIQQVQQVFTVHWFGGAGQRGGCASVRATSGRAPLACSRCSRRRCAGRR